MPREFNTFPGLQTATKEAVNRLKWSSYCLEQQNFCTRLVQKQTPELNCAKSKQVFRSTFNNRQFSAPRSAKKRMVRNERSVFCNRRFCCHNLRRSGYFHCCVVQNYSQAGRSQINLKHFIPIRSNINKHENTLSSKEFFVQVAAVLQQVGVLSERVQQMPKLEN